MPGIWLFYFAGSVLALIVGIRIKTKIIDPTDPISAFLVTIKLGAIISGGLGVAICLAMLIVWLLK